MLLPRYSVQSLAYIEGAAGTWTMADSDRWTLSEGDRPEAKQRRQTRVYISTAPCITRIPVAFKVMPEAHRNEGHEPSSCEARR
eukprot:3780985-Pleurochrysis_carterae.AAC.1